MPLTEEISGDEEIESSWARASSKLGNSPNLNPATLIPFPSSPNYGCLLVCFLMLSTFKCKILKEQGKFHLNAFMCISQQSEHWWAVVSPCPHPPWPSKLQILLISLNLCFKNILIYKISWKIIWWVSEKPLRYASTELENTLSK